MFGENSRGLIWHLRIFIPWVPIIRFSWKLANEEQSRAETVAFAIESFQPEGHLIAISLQGKPASPCIRRIGIFGPEETPDSRLLVGKIARNTHCCRN
jgi:hypothetical protein